MKALNSLFSISVLALAVLATVVITGCGQQTPPAPASGGTAPLEAAPPEAVTSVPPAPAPLPPEKREAPAAETSKPAAPVEPAVAEPASPPEVKAETPEPSPASDMPKVTAQANEAKLKSQGWFKWYEDRTTLKKSGKKDKKAEEALAETAKQLSLDSPPVPINDSVEFVAFDWKVDGDAPGDSGKVSYMASWLFHKNGDAKLESDHRVVLVLRGTPDPAHLPQLATSLPSGRTFFEFTYPVDPPIDTWEKGEYYLVTNKTIALPCIPYQMITIFSEQMKVKDGKWQYVAPYAEQVKLGWRADLGENSKS